MNKEDVFLKEGTLVRGYFDKYMRYGKNFVRGSIFFLMLLLLSACAKKTYHDTILCNVDEISPYSKIVEESLQGFTIEQYENMPYEILRLGGVAEAFDTQAFGAIETGLARKWYPHYLATVIIAVDRDKTNRPIASWQDLYDCDEEVGLFYRAGDINMIISAIAYGLEGEKYSLKQAIDLLKSIQEKRQLKINTFDTAIMICYDYQAVSLINTGRNLEIVIPSEGTFTYEKGLLSPKTLSFETAMEENPLSGNLRLLGETGNNKLYPSVQAYSPAKRVQDYTYFAKNTRNIEAYVERVVLHRKRGEPVNVREDIIFIFVYIMIITIWTASIVVRSMQKGIRYSSFFMGCVLLAWAFVRLIKHQLVLEDVWIRYLWYTYYIFRLSTPLLLIWMAWVVDKPEEQIFPPKWWRNTLFLIFGLILLVFTNDLHSFVLKLDPTRLDWSIHYGYGWGYYLILFVSMTIVLGVLVLLFQKGIQNPRGKNGVLPVLVVFLFGVYNYGYITRVPLIYDTDATSVTGICIMLLFESGIWAGLIPVNTKYIKLFIRSPLKMQITDQKGKVILSSKMEKTETIEDIPNQLLVNPISIFQEEERILYSNPIPGGYAIWEEDMGKLYEMHRKLEKSTQMLKKTNRMLMEEEEVQRAINEEEAKKELMEQLEGEIAESLGKMLEMIEKLSTCKKKSKETTRIALLLCYIKRRTSLFFQEKEYTMMLTDTLFSYVEELAEIARYSGVRIANVNALEGNIDIKYGRVFYDFYHAVIDWLVQKECGSVIEYLEMDRASFSMRFLLSENIEGLEEDSKLVSAVSLVKGKIEKKELEDAMVVCLSLPKGGQ